MFIGHFGAGLAAKKIDRKPSLGTLFLAAQFLDLLWPVFLLLGIEEVKIQNGNIQLNFTYYPFSHSLLFTLIWGFLFGLIYFLYRKDLKSSILLGCLVLSHWILDLIVHVPDLPIFPGSSIKAGFGLWNYMTYAIILELIIFAAGIYFYIKATKAKNKAGLIGLWGLFIFLLVIYVMSTLGSAPPSVNAVAIAGLSQWIIVGWGYWVDKNRVARNEIPFFGFSA